MVPGFERKFSTPLESPRVRSTALAKHRADEWASLFLESGPWGLAGSRQGACHVGGMVGFECERPGGPVSEIERKRHLEMLKDTPSRLRSLLKGMPKKLYTWTPAPGKWSILEIVCHMRDMESDAYRMRYERMLTADNPTMPDIDGDQYALEKDYKSQKLAEAFRAWSGLRRQCLKLLGAVRGDQWQRMGTHETAGPLTIEALVQRQAIGNDQAHLSQIEAIRRRFAILARLEKAPERLAKALKGRSDEALRRQPEPGKWSATEIVCHLRDREVFLVERLAKMAFQSRPQLWKMNNDRLAEIRRYKQAEAARVSREYRSLREDTLTLLRALPHPVWQRSGFDPELGELTIERAVEDLAAHDEHHLSSLEGDLGTT